MATIRASCDTCGDVELTSEDVQVRIQVEVEGHYQSGSYHFRCKKCGLVVVKEAEPRIINLLVQCGVKSETWKLPAEIYEPHSGPPISHDDLLDFHTMLQDDDWLDQFEEGNAT